MRSTRGTAQTQTSSNEEVGRTCGRCGCRARRANRAAEYSGSTGMCSPDARMTAALYIASGCSACISTQMWQSKWRNGGVAFCARIRAWHCTSSVLRCDRTVQVVFANKVMPTSARAVIVRCCMVLRSRTPTTLQHFRSHPPPCTAGAPASKAICSPSTRRRHSPSVNVRCRGSQYAGAATQVVMKRAKQAHHCRLGEEPVSLYITFLAHAPPLGPHHA